MTRQPLALAALAALTLTSAALAQRATTASYNEEYGVLTDRNMFMRERHAPFVRDTRPRPRIIDDPKKIARSYVLRGVAIEDAELHAYLENRRTGDIARVAPGDKLADGTVVDIAIDAIAFNADGKTTWVEVGDNLFGSRSSDVDNTPTTNPASTQPIAPGAPLPPGASLEERLKARRAQMHAGK